MNTAATEKKHYDKLAVLKNKLLEVYKSRPEIKDEGLVRYAKHRHNLICQSDFGSKLYIVSTKEDGTDTSFNFGLNTVTAHKKSSPNLQNIPIYSEIIVECNLIEYDVSIYIPFCDRELVDDIFSSRLVHVVMAIMRALRERRDQIMIDAIDEGLKAADTDGFNIWSPDTPYTHHLTVDHLLLAQRKLTEANIPETNRHIIMDAYAREALMYFEPRFRRNGLPSEYLGFELHFFDSNETNGERRDVLVWHKDAIGVATEFGNFIEVKWISEKQLWLIVSSMRCGAVTSKAKGCGRIELRSPSERPRPNYEARAVAIRQRIGRRR